MHNTGDTAWMLTSTALVLLMTLPALALFYAGLVQAKNVISVLAQCFAIACVASVLWFVCAYSMAFSGTGPWLGDFAAAFLQHADRGALHAPTAIPESVFVMYQMTFAIITPGLIVGAYVERIKFSAVILISALWLLIVYAPVAHWVWGGGWLGARGVMDYAGGIVVHVTAGVSALVMAAVLGPRADFPAVRPPHAPWMVMVGAALLWVGWFGFNAGSAVAANGDAGMAMLATHLAAATATLVWMAIECIKFGKPSLVGAVTGTIAGLACVTPASGFVGPIGGVALGAAAAIICFFAVLLIKRVMKIDDALDVLAVHGVGGALGTLLLPFLVGLGIGGAKLANATVGDQFTVQLTGVVSVAIYSAVASFIIMMIAKFTVGLRVDRETENIGLDLPLHGETGYNLNN